MEDNLKIYNLLRNCPQEAKKEIKAGKLKGFTDVNPMWRIKKLTELFGICGFGWYTEVINKWIEQGTDGKVAAFVEINLYVKYNEEWSKPIYGIGGSTFVNIFKGSPETSDEAFKMAYTDALSVACKALGMAADVYYAKDRTKYNNEENFKEEPVITDNEVVCPVCGKIVQPVTFKNGRIVKPEDFITSYGMCADCCREKKGKQ